MTQRRLLLTTDVIGGVWDFCTTLAAGLRAQGDSVSILALGSPSPDQRRTAEQHGLPLFSEPVKLEWMVDADADVKATRQLVADVARETRADVVHANQFAAACADVSVPVILTVHSDVLSWRRWTLGLHEVPAEWHAYAALAREGLRRADALVAVSQFLADEIRALYGTQRTLDVIYNGWPPPRRALRKTNHETLVAGRVWDQAKNIGLVAEAARGWNPGPVYLAGDTSHPDGGVVDVPPELKPLGVLDRASMDDWLDRAAVYISPAKYDPFGLLPLQAALHGCALILSDIPSYRELWEGAACFFKSNDAGDLRRAWQTVREDMPQMQHLALQRATRRYSTAYMVQAYQTRYALAKAETRVAA